MARKFKCRNGSVVEEFPRAGTFTNDITGYIDDYVILSLGEGVEETPVYAIDAKHIGAYMCIPSIGVPNLPMGRAHGPDWDIVEEIFF